MADVFFTERGQERLNEQDSETKDRIKKKLREICDWPDHFLKPLKGRNDYVLRVGDYRVLIDWRKNDGENGEDVLYVKSVGHRRNFYDRET
jgi:mRNA interferase RelE/StbE